MELSYLVRGFWPLLNSARGQSASASVLAKGHLTLRTRKNTIGFTAVEVYAVMINTVTWTEALSVGTIECEV